MPSPGHVWQVDHVTSIIFLLLLPELLWRVLRSCFFFLSIATLAVAQNMRELYRLVLVDTPLAPYFSECITSEVLFPAPSFAFSLMHEFLTRFCYNTWGHFFFWSWKISMICGGGIRDGMGWSLGSSQNCNLETKCGHCFYTRSQRILGMGLWMSKPVLLM